MKANGKKCNLEINSMGFGEIHRAQKYVGKTVEVNKKSFIYFTNLIFQ